MNTQLAVVCARARIVALLRSHFEVMDAFVAPGSLLFLDCPSQAFADSILMDLTPGEQKRIRFNCPKPATCEVCSGTLAAACARCAGPACAACDTCKRCGVIFCGSCNGAHPHLGPASP